MVADTANEATTLDKDVHRLRYKEFYAAEESVDLYLFILCNGCIPQIHSDASEESIEPGAVEWLATIDILITAIAHAAADALSVFTNRQRTLQPLVGVTAIAVDNKAHAYIYQQTNAEIGNPRLL